MSFHGFLPIGPDGREHAVGYEEEVATPIPGDAGRHPPTPGLISYRPGISTAVNCAIVASVVAFL